VRDAGEGDVIALEDWTVVALDGHVGSVLDLESCYKKTDSRSYVRKLQFRVINTTFFRNCSETSVITDI
jgi:hypothetical protein